VLQLRLTHEQCLARALWFHRTRRRWGALLFVIGLAVFVGPILLEQRMDNLLRDLGGMMAGVSPTTQPVQVSSDLLYSYYQLGLKTGVMLGKGLTTGMMLMLLGILLLLIPAHASWGLQRLFLRRRRTTRP
jgi:hypothetical protein